MALTKVDDRGLKTPIDLLDNENIRLGTGNDLKLYHDGSNSHLNNITGNLLIGTNGEFQVLNHQENEYRIRAHNNGGVDLYYDHGKKLETTNGGVSITGELNVTTKVAYPDNAKAIFGTSDDLQIYHDSSTPQNLINSYTSNPLNIMSNGDTSIKSNNGDNMGVFKKDGAVELYHNNDLRLQTWSDGVNIYGDEGESAILHLYADDGDDNADKWKLESNATNNSFYLATYASGSWLSKFSVDTSGKVSVGGETPIYNLNVRGSGQQTLLVGSTDAGGAYLTLDGDSNGDGQSGDYCSIGNTTAGNLEIVADNPNGDAQLIFKAGNAVEVMRVVGNGEVGIGIDNPAAYGANGTGYLGLVVQAPTGNYSGITIRSNYAGGGLLAFADGSGSTAERKNLALQADHPNKRLNVLVDGAGVARFSANGFHPNPADSAAANALDDYEEGTHTPSMYTDSGSITLKSSADTLAYTKIGRVVHVTGRLDMNSVSSPSGDLGISLPFTVANNITDIGASVAPSVFIYNATGGATGEFVAWADGNVTAMYIRLGSNTYGTGAASLMQANTEIRVSATYFTHS